MQTAGSPPALNGFRAWEVGSRHVGKVAACGEIGAELPLRFVQPAQKAVTAIFHAGHCALGADATSQGRFICAHITLHAATKVNHHQGKSKADLAPFALSQYGIDQLCPAVIHKVS